MLVIQQCAALGRSIVFQNIGIDEYRWYLENVAKFGSHLIVIHFRSPVINTFRFCLVLQGAHIGGVNAQPRSR